MRFSSLFQFRGLVLLLMVVLVAVIGWVPYSEAQSNNRSIRVRINNDLDFGRFTKPLSGNGTVTVTESDALSSSSNIQIVSSAGAQGARANLNIRGGAGETIHASFSSRNNVTGVQFLRFFGTYECLQRCNFSGNFNLNNNQDITFSVDDDRRVRIRIDYGADMRITSNAATGNIQPQYDFIVEYE